jgi:hypothetical protein
VFFISFICSFPELDKAVSIPLLVIQDNLAH